MKRKIVLSNQEVNYTYRRLRRAKRLTITVRRDASVLVTSPRIFPVKLVERSLLKQADWVLKKISEFQNSQSLFFETKRPEEYRRYKALARNFITKKIINLNKNYRFSFNRVSIRNQGSVWGSCSEKGNLNFNYKVYFLPDHLADYVIVHELCHLQELNHSKNFWNLVAQTVPDYQQRIKELKEKY